MIKKPIYDADFYNDQKFGSYRSATILIPIILEMIQVESVCDVGCGIGTWLQCWQENGVDDILGIDGNYVARDQLVIPAERFRAFDLRQPIRSARSFDLAMSLEVAEHLPPNRGLSFVEDLTKLSPIILFSAAIPGQGGRNHVNERWQSYWAALFDQFGYSSFDVLRPRVWDDCRIERWYRQNLLIFCRRNVIDDYPALTSVHVNAPLSVVHPMQFTEKWKELDARESFVALRGALARAIVRRTNSIRRRIGAV